MRGISRATAVGIEPPVGDQDVESALEGLSGG